MIGGGLFTLTRLDGLRERVSGSVGEVKKGTFCNERRGLKTGHGKAERPAD